LKGAEAAAELERKKAAAEMAERLPGLHDANDPNAAAAKPPVMGPDGKPLPVVPVTPKPIPALHPDRFTPGASSESPNAASDASPDIPADDPGASSKPKAQTGPAKPNSNKPPKSPQFSATRGPGGVQ
jgi:rod shape-determining protein MreC